MKKQFVLWFVVTIMLCICLCSCVKDNVKDAQAPMQPDTTDSIRYTDAKLGESISLEFVTVTFDHLEVADRYDFSYTEKTSVGTGTKNTSLEPSSGMRLVSLVGTFQNKTNKAYYTSNRGVSGKFIINGNEYDARLACFDTEKAERFLEVAAQQSTTCFFYAEVPQNVAEKIDSCTVQLGFTNNLESKFVGSIDDLDYVFQLDVPTAEISYK